VLYTGDGASGRNITGIGFTPDLVWVKLRDVSQSHYIFDSVRGAAAYLQSDTTGAESVSTSSLTSFNSDGFSYGNFAGGNYNTGKYVAWCWRAGAGTTTANTDGSIPSVVSVNQDAGFSIVSYTGNGTIGATVGHGLGKKPKFFMTKNRDTAALDWPVFSEELLGSNGYIYLNKTNAAATIANISGPTSSVLTLSGYNDNNKSGDRFIAYCWAEIEGFSKFGSYVGNGSADGAFVYCGFKPAFIFIKNATTAGTQWLIWDNARTSNNPSNIYQIPNQALIDQDTGADIDFLSNGFKVRNTSISGNSSGATIIFAAFAESPFTTANAK